MVWEIIRTDIFLKDLKKVSKVGGLLKELDKKIKRLKEEPKIIGGQLHGELHPSKSTRLSRKFRLIFQIDEKNNKVCLEAIDHRKDIY